MGLDVLIRTLCVYDFLHDYAFCTSAFFIQRYKELTGADGAPR